MLLDLRTRESAHQTRRTFSSLSEDFDQDHKSYRATLALFVQNLNSYTRSYQSCIGDLEEHQKVRVRGEEIKNVENQLGEMCQRHMGKLSRESVYRNAAIRKAYQNYTKEYEPFSEIFKRQQWQSKSFLSFKTPKKSYYLGHAPSSIKTDTDKFRKRIRRASFASESVVVSGEIQSAKPYHVKTNSFVCKLSQFKAFDSQQIFIASPQIHRIKTSYERDSVVTRIRMGSLSLKASQEPENKDNKSNKETTQNLGTIGEEEFMNQSNRTKEQQNWQVQKPNNLLKPIKQTCFTTRVFAIKNRGPLMNPQRPSPRPDFLRQSKKLHCISVAQPQGYSGRSKVTSKSLLVK